MVGEINYSILDQNAPLKTAQAWDIPGAVTDGMANSLARKQAEQSQQINALSLQKAQRDMADEESVRNALSGAGGDWDAAAKAMMEGGQYKQAIDLKTKLQDQKTKQIQQQVESLKLVKSAADFVFANPTPENAVATLQQLTQRTGQDFSGEIAAVQNMSPEQIQKWAAGHSLTAKDMMVKTEKMDLGGTSNLMSVDPVTGKVVGQQAFNKTMSPEGMAADARGWAGVEQGKVPSGYRRSADGNLEAIPGGPGDPKNKKGMMRNEDGSYSPVTGSGKRELSAQQTKLISEGAQLKNVLGPIDDLIKNKPHLFGPVSGRVASANPYNTEAQDADATLRRAAQVIGSYMEGGVLRKEDEIKYQKMLPRLGDTKEVAERKKKGVQEMLEKKQTQLLADYNSAGFDVDAFKKQAPTTTPTVSNW